MINDVDQEKSKKFYLVRIEGRKAINSILETPSIVTNADFQISFDKFYPFAFAFDDTYYTEVSSPIGMTGGKYYIDRINKIAVFKLHTGFPADYLNSTYIALMTFFYFFTQGENKEMYLIPTLNTTPLVDWDNRIIGDPSFEQSIENVLVGLFTLRSGSIDLNNYDQYFNDFEDINISFNKSPIVFWRCINTVDNFQLAFVGLINQIKIQNRLSISFDDYFSILDKKFYANTNFTDSTYLNQASPYQFLRDQDKFIPIRKLYGVVSAYGHIDEYGGGVRPIKRLDSTNTCRAINVDYIPDAALAFNRTWSCIVAFANSGDGDYVAPMTSYTQTATTGDDDCKLGGLDVTKFRLGDNVKVGASVVQHFVSKITSTEIWIWPPPFAPYAGNETVTRKGISNVVIEQNGVRYYPMPIRDFIEVIGVNGEVCIVFYYNFEANVGMPDPLDPDANIYFRCWNDPTFDVTHGQVISDVLFKAGIASVLASINQANIDLVANMGMTIPLVGENDSGSIKSYIQLMLASTFGFLYVDNDGFVNYKILLQGEAASGDITDDDYLKGSLSSEISYNDVYNEFKQNHKSFVNDDYDALFSSKIANVLHNISKRLTIDSYLDDPTFQSLQQIAKYLSSRKRLNFLKTKTLNFNNVIGDVQNITGRDIDTKATIISIDKSATKTSLGLMDDNQNDFDIIQEG